jgi:hypothetical protein
MLAGSIPLSASVKATSGGKAPTWTVWQRVDAVLTAARAVQAGGSRRDVGELMKAIRPA